MKKFDNLLESIVSGLFILSFICLCLWGLYKCLIVDFIIEGIWLFSISLFFSLPLLIFILIFGFRYYIINDNEVIRKKKFHKKIIIKFDEITAIEKGKSYVFGYMAMTTFDKYDTYFVYNSSGKKIDLIDDANLKEVLSKNDAFNKVFKKFTCAENDKQ